MAVSQLCTQDDVEFIWSLYGVAVRLDDGDTSSSAARMTAMLNKATADVQFYLLQRYDVAALASNEWVKWCTALHCAVDLAKRRGNAPPASMAEELQRYKELLLEVKEGRSHLPSDTGRAAPKFDGAPMLSNMRVDTRFRSAVRRVPHTSTQTPQAPSRRHYESVGPYPFLYW